MKKEIIQKISAYLAIIVAIEIWSYIAFSYPTWAPVIFITLSLSFAAITIYRLEYGLLVIIIELIVGSMGRMFHFDTQSYSLSIRTSFFFIMMVVFFFRFLVQFIRDKKESAYLKNIIGFQPFKYFALLGFFIFLGLVNALLKGQGLAAIFSDINGWLFFLLLLPVIAVIDLKQEKTKELLKLAFVSAVIWLGIKTLLLLSVFTHNLYFAPEIYLWLRKTLVGEMTPTLSGWPRIFIQSQIFSAAAYFLFFWLSRSANVAGKFLSAKNISYLLISSLSLSAVIISFSRSFWLAFAISVLFSLVILWCLDGFKKMIRGGLWMLVSLVTAFLMIYAVVAFPYFNFKGGNLDEGLIDRVSGGSGEAAIASRWSLLPELFKEIKKNPLSGQGFGAALTYYSSDPRVLENNPSGEYTTSAFEWGYLDIWLKIGIGGLISYLFLLAVVIVSGIKKGFSSRNVFYFGLSAAIVFLAVTNAFTPYLNHPLGIGLLLVSSCLIYRNEVY